MNALEGVLLSSPYFFSDFSFVGELLSFESLDLEPPVLPHLPSGDLASTYGPTLLLQAPVLILKLLYIVHHIFDPYPQFVVPGPRFSDFLSPGCTILLIHGLEAEISQFLGYFGVDEGPLIPESLQLDE